MTQLLRDDLVKLVSEWKNGTLGGSDATGSGVKKILLHNTGTGEIGLGAPVVITGRQTEEATAEEARREYLTSGFRLAGRSPTSEDFESGEPIIGTAVAPIRAGGCGFINLPGIFAAEITVSEETDKRVKPSADGYISGTAGDYRIIARADTFAFLLRDPIAASDPKVKNTTTTDLVAGEVLMVDWWLNDTTSTPDELFAKYQAEGVILKGVQPTGSQFYVTAVLLEDCAAGETARCVLNGVFGALVRSDSEMTFIEADLDFFPFCSADLSLDGDPSCTPFKLVSTRNNVYDRHFSRTSSDWGLGCPPVYRIISYSQPDANNRFFAFLIPNEKVFFLGSVSPNIQLTNNRWLYSVEEVLWRYSSSNHHVYPDLPSSTAGYRRRRGWAYNLCENYYQQADYSGTRTTRSNEVRLPVWDAVDKVWKKEETYTTLSQKVYPASGVAVIYGDSFSGWVFCQTNIPYQENLLLFSESDSPAFASPEIKAGTHIAFSDGGSASDDIARSEGNGKKTTISWTGLTVNTGTGTVTHDVQKIVFNARDFNITFNSDNTVATVSLRSS